jgi:hypothetical protein
MKHNLLSFDLKPPPAASECVRELFALEPEFADNMHTTATLSPYRPNWGGRELCLVFLVYLFAAVIYPK